MKKRLIDTHCDTLMFYSQDFDGFVGGPWKVTLDKMSTYDAYLGTFAMYYDLTQTQQQRLEQAQALPQGGGASFFHPSGAPRAHGAGFGLHGKSGRLRRAALH